MKNTTNQSGIKNYKLKSRLWLVSKDGTFLGEGRIALLEAVDKFGSISKAANSMNMSYLKAWKLVDSMNKESEQIMVIKIPGGKGGGGSKLTDYAMNAISWYKEICHKCVVFLEKEIQNSEIERTPKTKR